MSTLLFACQCSQSFNYHVPVKDGTYAVHCPACLRKLTDMSVFDSGKDYEACNPSEGNLDAYHVVALDKGLFLIEHDDYYETTAVIADATHYPCDILPVFHTGEMLMANTNYDRVIVTGVLEAFIHTELVPASLSA